MKHKYFIIFVIGIFLVSLISSIFALKEDFDFGGGGRAIKAGARGADLIQTVDKANDVGRVASGTGKAIGTVEKIGDVGRGIDKAGDLIKTGSSLRGAANPVVRATIERGKQEHKLFSEALKEKGFIVDKPVFSSVNSKARPDAIDPISGKIYELKPNTPSGVAKGRAQLKEYTDLAKKVFPNINDWKGRLITYG